MLGRYSFDFDDSDEGTSSSLPRKPPATPAPAVPVRTSSIKKTGSTGNHHRIILTPFAVKFIRRSPPVKSLWLITLVVCSALSGFHFWRLTSHFNSGRTVLTQGRQVPFIFPDVTFCPPSAFFRRNILKDSRFHGSNKSFGMNILPHTVPALWRYILYKNISHEHLSQTQKEYTARLALQSIHRHYMNSSSVLTALDLVAYCRYQGDLCSMNNFSVFFHPVFGSCVTFRPPKRVLHQSYFDYDKPGLVLQLHTLSPMEWLLTTDSETSMTHRDGFSVTLHPPMTWPNFAQVAHVSSHRITSIRASMTQIWRTSLHEDSSALYRFQNFLSPVSYCFGGQSKLCHAYTSQFSDRLLLIRQFELLSKCSCLSDSLPIPANLSDHPSCVGIRDPELLLFDPRKVKLVGKYLYIIDRKGELRWIEDTSDFRKFRQALECFLRVYPRPLSKEKLDKIRPDPISTLYSIQTDSGPWFQSADTLQAGYIAKNLKLYFDEITFPEAKRLNVSLPVQKYLKDMKKIEFSIHAYKALQKMTGILEVRPSALTGEQLEQVWIYPLSCYLADIGGSAGLLLGISLVSLLETLDALLLYLYSGRRTRSMKRSDDCGGSCKNRYRKPCRHCDTRIS